MSSATSINEEVKPKKRKMNHLADLLDAKHTINNYSLGPLKLGPDYLVSKMMKTSRPARKTKFYDPKRRSLFNRTQIDFSPETVNINPKLRIVINPNGTLTEVDDSQIQK